MAAPGAGLAREHGEGGSKGSGPKRSPNHMGFVAASDDEDMFADMVVDDLDPELLALEEGGSAAAAGSGIPSAAERCKLCFALPPAGQQLLDAEWCDSGDLEPTSICSSCLAKNPGVLQPVQSVQPSQQGAAGGVAGGSSSGKQAVLGSDAKRPRLQGPTAGAAPEARVRTHAAVQANCTAQHTDAAVQVGSSHLMPLIEAVLVSSGKWEALAEVAAALGQLEASGLPAAARQGQVDAALFAALRNSSPEACAAVVRMLLDAGASTAAVDSSGNSVLVAFLLHMPAQLWSEQQTAAMVQTLVKAGASATASAAAADGMNPLQAAVRLQAAPAVRGALASLGAAGADIKQTDSLQRTLLHQAAAHCASQEGLAAGIQALLSKGCDALAVDADGRLAYALLDSNPAQPLEEAADMLMQGMAARAVADRRAAAALKAQHDSLQTCVVCLQRPRSTALFPCGHFALCSACAPRCATCPVCRRRVESSDIVHLA